MIIHGDCLDKMREMEDNSIDFIVCDPPYGLSFMGKKWDETTPDIKIWKEALRICKPGSMLAAFGGSRTHHHLMTSLEWAGWEIRDVIMWLYGSGFPKSHNFGKKPGGIWEPYGTALKPAYEPIILCQKPLDGTFAQNADKWVVAGINIDESRIKTNEYITNHSRSTQSCISKGIYGDSCKQKTHQTEGQKLGRWPANLILDESAVEQLDEMTGISKSGKNGWNPTEKDSGMWAGKKRIPYPGYNDSGGASRFFYCAKASSSERNRGLEGMPLKQTMGGGGLNNTDDDVCGKYGSIKSKQYNSHPTVKPISLMKYILKLLAPPGDPICLDPFAGSGTTLLAAKELGIRAIGIELEKEYCEIAEKRLSAI
jgi:site-specific DNA-methyltransferase (adenine-specific)